ncbi:hypothetical protein [Echinicola arenosa]|nr:hypothetical protein [Echinicola arenosa]
MEKYWLIAMRDRRISKVAIGKRLLVKSAAKAQKAVDYLTGGNA